MKSNSGGRSVGVAEVDEAFDGKYDDGWWENIKCSEEVKEFFFLLEETLLFTQQRPVFGLQLAALRSRF